MARTKVDNKLNVVIGTKAQVEADNTIPENSIVVVTDEELKVDWQDIENKPEPLQFSGGLLKEDDNVTLANNAITNEHINANAAIALSKLGTHTGNTTNWDVPTLIAPSITQPTTINERLTDLAMTIWRIRGDVGLTESYGEWNTNSLSLSKVRNETYSKTEIDTMIGDIESALDAILGV